MAGSSRQNGDETQARYASSVFAPHNAPHGDLETATDLSSAGEKLPTPLTYLVCCELPEAKCLIAPPVWMMRQAGRYMKAYRDLRGQVPLIPERSEIPEVAIEVSLQPWRAFQPDGVILFSRYCYTAAGTGY